MCVWGGANIFARVSQNRARIVVIEHDCDLYSPPLRFLTAIRYHQQGANPISRADSSSFALGLPVENEFEFLHEAGLKLQYLRQTVDFVVL